MAKSFKVITLGCKVNQYESAYLKEALAGAGCFQAGKGEEGDLVIVNTCIVTRRAAHQSRQAIRKAVRENPNGSIAAVGCYAQAFPQEISEIEGVCLIADNVAKKDLPDLLLQGRGGNKPRLVLSEFESGAPFDFLKISRFPGRTRAYLKIQDGCQSMCSYCIVPFARGPYRSLSPEKVLGSIEALSGAGVREVVLAGIHLGKYGIDLKGGIDLAALLEMVGKEDWPVRIRLSSIEPNEIDRGMMEMMASESWLCRHFHVPLQSGDPRILKRMNRGYTDREFAGLVETMYTMIPHVAIGVDVMAGFPGEDSAAHMNSHALISDLPISYLHVFPFSARPGTAASTFKGRVDTEIVKNRAAELRDLGRRKMRLFYERCLYDEFPVLTEGWNSEEKNVMKGTSDNYLPVLFPSSNDREGQIVRVRMERVEGDTVVGTL